MVMAMALTAGFFASCSEEGAWDAYDTTSTPTYSFEQKTSNYVLTPADTMYQIPVRVFRNNTNGNVTIPVSVNISDETVITCDTSVVIFENGKDCTELMLGLAFDKLEVGAKYTAKIEFVVDSVNYFEHNASISGNSMTEVSVQLEMTWEPIGKALYTDDILTLFFQLPEIVTYEVEAETVKGTGLVRIKNAYGAVYPYNEEGDYDAENDYYIVFNCTDPDGVYIDGFEGTGLNWTYGELRVTSYGYYLMAYQGFTFEQAKAEGVMGTLDENLCITFPVKGLVASMPDLGTGYANKNGAFKLDLSTTTLAE